MRSAGSIDDRRSNISWGVSSYVSEGARHCSLPDRNETRATKLISYDLRYLVSLSG